MTGGHRTVRALVALAVALVAPALARAADPPKDIPYPHGEWTGECTDCHREDRWIPAAPARTWKHPAKFPLAGAHKTAACRECHKSLEFDKVGKACVECHRDVHRGEFGIDCARCHTTRNFLDRAEAARNHRATRFPLTGAHAVADCDACHRLAPEGRSSFVNLPVNCDACHNRTGFPGAEQRPADHAQNNFPLDCVQCHTTISFSNARFDHNLTGFPLTGQHVALDCVRCHGTPFNRDLDPTCYACHRAAYEGTTDPNHVQAGFPTDCTQCHDTRSWNSSFNHAATGFPIDGQHVPLSCVQCHGTPFNRNLDPACVACHQRNYDATTEPNHRQASFPTDCKLCHTTMGWDGANFNHNNTQFPLTGAHVPLQCSACHADGVYRGKSTACVSCHQADYNGTRDPNHQQAGFPTDCTLCHTTATWAGASFNHATTQFPLTGAHVGLQCSACHADGVYRGKPTDCYSCHRGTFDSQTDPNHVAANFSHDCASCHPGGTTTWAGGRYTAHDGAYFPIYSGSHNNRWNRCSECHTTSGNYAAFSCLGCHAQTETNNRHRNVNGYSYDSAACYRCHPTGRGD